MTRAATPRPAVVPPHGAPAPDDALAPMPPAPDDALAAVPPSASPVPPAPDDALAPVLTWLRAALAAAGIDEAPLEAELLLRHAIGADRAELYAHPARRVGADALSALRRLAERRRTREPLPYILGAWEFCGLEFAVTPDVLIPRPETETLVEEALAWASRRSDAAPLAVADVGTGSGCVAVALACRLPGARVTAVDISAAALRIAAANAARHGVAGRVYALQGDLLDAVAGPLDLIAANLPYLPDADVPGLQPEVSRYEPRVALGGGPDGLSLMRRLLARAPSTLAPGGAVMLEFNPPQRADLERIARAAFPSAAVRVVRDLTGADRVLVVDTAGRAAA